MASVEYILGRKKYSRPQALLFADNPGTLKQTESDEYFYVPDGIDVLADSNSVLVPSDNKFLILSDDNRSPLEFNINRVENRLRMINGRMRSYHIADKLSISASWNMIPSRSAASLPKFNDLNGRSKTESFTTDGGAGGVELLDWYEKNTGSFWVYLSYDKYNSFGEVGKSDLAYNNLPKYSQIVEMFFADFSYSVEKRGGSNYDFWNINLTLEEV